jgi:hypothetical protein
MNRVRFVPIKVIKEGENSKGEREVVGFMLYDVGG